MAGLTNLVTSFVRRITKYYEAGSFPWPRPKSAPPGSNHIDNPTDFDGRTIYRGEEIVDFELGKVYTQDGVELIQPNTPPSILEGLAVHQPGPGVVGSSPMWLTVDSGAGRVYGRNYYHESSTINGDIQLVDNVSPLARIDIIVLEKSSPLAPAPVALVPAGNTEYAGAIAAITGTNYLNGRALTFFRHRTNCYK